MSFKSERWWGSFFRHQGYTKTPKNGEWKKGDFRIHLVLVGFRNPQTTVFCIYYCDKPITKSIVNDDETDDLETVIKVIEDPEKAPLLAGIEWAGDVMALLLKMAESDD